MSLSVREAKDSLSQVIRLAESGRLPSALEYFHCWQESPLSSGISAVMMIPAPLWFNVLDLVVAYIPMAYLGGKLVAKK